MKKEKLTEKGKSFMEDIFYQDTIKEIQLDSFPTFTQQEIIAALNYAGEQEECDIVRSFLMGMVFERNKLKRLKNEKRN